MSTRVPPAHPRHRHAVRSDHAAATASNVAHAFETDPARIRAAWASLAPPGADLDARQAELKTIAEALLHTFDSDHVWLIWQVVRLHIDDDENETLLRTKDVRQANLDLAAQARQLIARLSRDINALIRLHEHASQRKWYGLPAQQLDAPPRRVDVPPPARFTPVDIIAQLADQTARRMLSRLFDPRSPVELVDAARAPQALRQWQRFPQRYALWLKVLQADPALRFLSGTIFETAREGNPQKRRNKRLNTVLTALGVSRARRNAILHAILFIPSTGR